MRDRGRVHHDPGDLLQPFLRHSPCYEHIRLETDVAVSQHGSHLADFLLVLHGFDRREEILLGEADALGQLCIWVGYKREIPLQRAHDCLFLLCEVLHTTPLIAA